MVIFASVSMRLSVNLKIRCTLGAKYDDETYSAEDLLKLLKVCNVAQKIKAIIAQRHADHVALDRCTINS
jgi:hypothetical protein